MEGNTHIAWMDGRDYGFEKDVNYEIYYTKLRLQGAGEFDGRDDGLSTYAIKKINDTPISNVETNAGLPQNAPWGGNPSSHPSLRMTRTKSTSHGLTLETRLLERTSVRAIEPHVTRRRWTYSTRSLGNRCYHLMVLNKLGPTPVTNRVSVCLQHSRMT